MSKEDKGKITMTVVHFETESDNATLQENVRVIAATVARALSNSRGNSGVQLKAMTSGERTSVDLSENVDPVAHEEIDAIDAEFESVSPPKPKGKSPSKPKTPPKLITLELDLVSGKPSLKDFMEDKNPQGDTKRYLCIAYWLKHHANTSPVTMHHMHTAYRHMGWSTPKNPNQPLMDMKQKNSWLNKASEPGAYAINHIGENVVNEMGKSE